MGAIGPHYLYIIRSVRMVYYAQCVFVQEEHTIWPTGRRARYSRLVSGVVTHKRRDSHFGLLCRVFRVMK